MIRKGYHVIYVSDEDKYNLFIKCNGCNMNFVFELDAPLQKIVSFLDQQCDHEERLGVLDGH